MKVIWYISSAVVALALAACSGGGGGGGGGGAAATQFTEFSTTAPSTTYEMPALTLVADYTVDFGDVNDESDDALSVAPSVANDATFQFALDDIGDVTSLAIASVPTISFNTGQGDDIGDAGLVDPIYSGYVVALANDENSFAFVSDSTAMGFEYQSFGVWLTGLNPGAGVIATMTAGAPTLAAGIPAGGATYNGQSTGIYVTAEGEPFQAFADFSADVDFDGLEVTNIAATNTQVINANTAAVSANADLNYTGSGTLAADGTFSATIAAAGLDGNMDGLLYGPAAEELGAVFDMNGLNGRFIGAVGAAAL